MTPQKSIAAFGAGLLCLGLATAQPGAARSQPAVADQSLAVPTTRLLAIGSFTAKAKPSVWRPIIPSEMRQTAALYLAGKIDQWYVKTDQTGVVFILNVTDPKDARALLDKLPLGQAGQMEFQLIPIGPLSPMRTLLTEPAK
jgi:hypothetical protein